MEVIDSVAFWVRKKGDGEGKDTAEENREHGETASDLLEAKKRSSEEGFRAVGALRC